MVCGSQLCMEILCGDTAVLLQTLDMTLACCVSDQSTIRESLHPLLQLTYVYCLGPVCLPKYRPYCPGAPARLVVQG
jgi:hypothetical protein